MEKNHWPGIVIRMITLIPRKITTNDGSHACSCNITRSYCNIFVWLLYLYYTN